jgi:hypothetical protein
MMMTSDDRAPEALIITTAKPRHVHWRNLISASQATCRLKPETARTRNTSKKTRGENNGISAFSGNCCLSYILGRIVSKNIPCILFQFFTHLQLRSQYLSAGDLLHQFEVTASLSAV